MLDSKNEIKTFSQKAHTKKSKYDKFIYQLENMFTTMRKAEKATIAQLYELNEQRVDPSIQGLHNDIATAHKRSRLESELSKINRINKKLPKI